MSDDIIALEFLGEVTLADFARGIQRFKSLIDSLSDEVAKGTSIDWTIDDLRPGSAFISLRGTARRSSRQDQVAEVVHAYGDVGRSLEKSGAIQRSDDVVKKADRLLELLKSKTVESLRVETSEADALIRLHHPAIDDVVREMPTGVATAYGVIEGRVQTVSNRGRLRFTLYDSLHDRAVSCYLEEGYEDIVRDAWGKRALVHGVVRRDQLTGRPLTVREVTQVDLLPDRNPKGYLAARGISPVPPGRMNAAEAIRKVRDG